MNKRISSILSLLLLVVLLGTLLASCGSSSSPSTSTPSSGTNGGGASAGQTLMQERCSVCHSTNRITSAHKTAAEWKSTVDRMIGHGAQLNASEAQTLVDYLAQTYK